MKNNNERGTLATQISSNVNMLSNLLWFCVIPHWTTDLFKGNLACKCIWAVCCKSDLAIQSDKRPPTPAGVKSGRPCQGSTSCREISKEEATRKTSKYGGEKKRSSKGRGTETHKNWQEGQREVNNLQTRNSVCLRFRRKGLGEFGHGTVKLIVQSTFEPWPCYSS